MSPRCTSMLTRVRTYWSQRAEKTRAQEVPQRRNMLLRTPPLTLTFHKFFAFLDVCAAASRRSRRAGVLRTPVQPWRSWAGRVGAWTRR